MPETRTLFSIGQENDNIVVLDNILGKGSCGIVYKGYFESNNIPVIVKKLYQPIEKYNIYMGELKLKELSHDNIPKFYSICEHENEKYLILQYFHGIPLDEIVNIPNIYLNEHLLKYIVIKMINIIDYLHSNNISHRDIKLENIIINKNQVYLIDFGFACDAKIKNIEFPGSVMYACPYLIRGEPHDDKKCDIWALAVCIYTLYYKEFPYRSRNPYLLNCNLINNYECPEIISFDNKKTSSELKYLLKNMFIVNQDKRFDLEQIKNSEWLKNYF